MTLDAVGKAKKRAYYQRPEVKARDDLWRREYQKRPEVKAKHIAWQRLRRAQPRVKANAAQKRTPGVVVEVPARPCPAACEACGGGGGKRGIMFDPSHVTGKFRGWPCLHCNFILAKHMTPALLRKLADILEETP
jgi:hypothetical protein